MKYLDEFRDGEGARRLVEEIRRVVSRPWVLMEVCGGQTHAIIRNGIDQVLPEGVELVHGPGCPVCVTPLEVIDRALAIAKIPGVTFCSFGDMLRVPGSSTDLSRARAEGADVRVVYSPLDALALARAHRDREVVFFGIGFETTAPANAMAVTLARRGGLGNFSILVSQVLVPPAIEAICASKGNRVQGFLAAGHVCTVMGTGQYPAIAERYRVPIVVTGFEPIDLLDGIRRAVVQLERGEARVENAYARVVSGEGNPVARALLDEVFEVTDQAWRGIGTIPNSGWRLAPAYRAFDAAGRFEVGAIRAAESPECRSGDVLQGRITPPECPAFGSVCTPRQPLGATMVSNEGACAAYYLNGRTRGANAHA
ncbi:hydrogenase formation protein HypD [Tautonia sp. JC769]|uniref:hydrogenase formation protein HypD n=1 Tax=Tautonia sp. JC769 TaxID=3232135 RepID=UPI0034590A96